MGHHGAGQVRIHGSCLGGSVDRHAPAPRGIQAPVSPGPGTCKALYRTSLVQLEVWHQRVSMKDIVLRSVDGVAPRSLPV